LWHCSKKVKAEAIPCIFGAPMSVFITHLVQNLWYLTLTL
jgi:hypothetical protein